jgi:PAS domain S-box-containing protein
VTKEQYTNERYTAQLHYWATLGIGAGSLLVLALAALDYASVPAQFGSFLSYRLVTASIMFLLYLINKKIVNRGLQNSSVVIVGAVVAAMVAAMVHDFHGHESPYYAGFILDAIFVAAIVPISFGVTVIAELLMYFLYLTPILAYDTITNKPYFLSANILILASFASLLLLQFLRGKQTLKQYELEYEQRESEEKLLYFKMAVASATDAIGMSTPDGRQYYQNEAYADLFGTDAVSGPPVTLYVDKQMGKKVYDTVMKGESFAGEVKMFDKDKNIKDIYVRAYSIRDEEDRVIGLVDMHTDITEQRHAEQKLRKSERQLRESQTVAKLGSWDFDLVSQKLEWSDQTFRLFDKNRKEFVPSLNEFIRFVHPDDLEKMKNDFDNVIKGNLNHYHVIVRIINDSGRKWEMEAFGVVRRDASGTALSIFGTAQDISKRKRAEEKIRQSEQFIRDILDTVDEGFIVIDKKYRILIANRAYCSQVGGCVENIIGRHCYEIAHGKDRPCYETGEECATRQAIETGKPHSAFHRRKDANGNFLYIETKAFPIKDASGNVTSVIETINNITDKHLLEEEKRHQREKEKILMDIHDGIGGITTNISLLSEVARKAQSPEDVKRALTTIANLSREGLGEIRSLMHSLDSKDLSWHTCAAELRSQGMSIVKAYDISFDMTSQIDDTSVEPGSILYLNLFRIYREALTNIVKHSQATKVVVSFRVGQENLTLTVQDNGRGRDPSAAVKSGRGLTNMKNRANEVGGTVTVSMDGGTCVYVIVPFLTNSVGGPVQFPSKVRE